MAAHATQAAATRAGAKSSPAATAKAAGKTAKPTGKKVAKGKSKKNKSTSHKPVVPQIPLAQGPSPETSDAEIALVRSAIDGLRSGGASKATSVQATISDPVARKLVEWIILRSDHNGASSTRYLAFIAANPSWPSLGMFRRRAEAMFWVENIKPAQALSFFNGSPPQSGMGHLVLARALLAQGDTEGASAQVRDAWRNDALSADVEKQVHERYSEFLSSTDHKARMEKRLFAADNEAAMRAARRLGGAHVAIAQARIALKRKGGEAKKPPDARKLLDAVPAEARHDAGYIFAHAHVLRHADKTAEAAQVMLSAHSDLAQIQDPEEWWVERQVLSRKLLDLGDARSAYLVVADAAEPTKENSRVERHFMAGWIALRFLDDPATAANSLCPHPGREQPPDVAGAVALLARARGGRLAQAGSGARRVPGGSERFGCLLWAACTGASRTWSARAGSAAGDPRQARRGGAAGACSRAGDPLRAQRALHGHRADGRPRRSLDDVGTLSALGELAEQHQDARGMLHLGKAARARGLPLDYYAFPTVGVPRYSPIGPGIDNAMLFAIIRQESAFNPADWSAAQAMGLMQVTPIAGRDTCKRFSCTYNVKRLKNDIPYNLQVGAAELGGLMQEYRGNHILAFAAYNAGRGRVRDWIARFGDPRDPKVDPVDWVERIPFMETRNYVQRVMENLQVYRTRFGHDAPLTTDADLRRGAAAN